MRPDFLTQCRDTAIVPNLLVIIAPVQGAFLLLATGTHGAEWLDILQGPPTWATVAFAPDSGATGMIR
jgi:hypothetical protein